MSIYVVLSVISLFENRSMVDFQIGNEVGAVGGGEFGFYLHRDGWWWGVWILSMQRWWAVVEMLDF